MSTSDLYILNGKSTTHLAEFRNGWGSGPRCWDHLSVKYLGSKFNMFDPQPTWDLAGSDKLAEHERIALMMTFDRSYVPIPCLREAAEACELFGAECEDGQMVNHWPAIAEALHSASKLRHNRHARGVVLNCTSVSDMWIDPSSD